MDFDPFLEQAWNDHAHDPAAVAQRLHEHAVALVQTGAQLVPMAHLAQHVLGEHLGRWREGLALLARLGALPVVDDAGRAALARFDAALRLAGGLDDRRDALAPGDRIRVTALAAGSLAEHDAARAGRLLDEAVAAADAAALPDTDPAHRALAVSGNNLAAALEERPDRSEAQRALMLRAAQVGRRFWALAGTWVETERAEYRLAMSWLQAGDTAQARQHAQNCLEIVRAHPGEQGEVPLEAFFGWEALARVERAAGNTTGHAHAREQAAAWFQRLEAGDQGWCRASLEALA